MLRKLSGCGRSDSPSELKDAICQGPLQTLLKKIVSLQKKLLPNSRQGDAAGSPARERGPRRDLPQASCEKAGEKDFKFEKSRVLLLNEWRRNVCGPQARRRHAVRIKGFQANKSIAEALL